MFSCFHNAYTKEKSKGLKENKVAEKWWDFLIQVDQTKPDWENYLIPYDNEFRLKIYYFVSNPIFDSFIMAIIISNLLTMAMNFEDQDIIYENVLGYINLIFTFTFIIECILKLIALGFTRYFLSAWNRFDFFVVIASVVDLCVSYATATGDGQVVNSQFIKSFQCFYQT